MNITLNQLKIIKINKLKGEKIIIALQRGTCFLSNQPLIDKATNGYNGQKIKGCFGIVTPEAKQQSKIKNLSVEELNEKLLNHINKGEK